MNAELIDWRALDRLRVAFLDGTAGTRDYWRRERDLESYDQTFGQRIAWKWDYVLDELTRRKWTPPGGELLDWGCGSGIAGRAFLRHFGPNAASALVPSDRSSLAVQYAVRKAREKFPGLNVRTQTEAGGVCHMLLLSHVITELSGSQIDELCALAAGVTALIWVEPGTHAASRTLIAVRERLRGTFRVVAPCTHAAACGMLASENHRHWCHHFASPPPQVFTDGTWARFANLAGIDLRSLPLSFLVLDKRQPPFVSPAAARVIGQPRVYKAHAQLLGCDATGVCERRLTRRALPEWFRRLKKGDLDPLQIWRCDGDTLVEVQPLAVDPQTSNRGQLT